MFGDAAENHLAQAAAAVSAHHQEIDFILGSRREQRFANMRILCFHGLHLRIDAMPTEILYQILRCWLGVLVALATIDVDSFGALQIGHSGGNSVCLPSALPFQPMPTRVPMVGCGLGGAISTGRPVDFSAASATARGRRDRDRPRQHDQV